MLIIDDWSECHCENTVRLALDFILVGACSYAEEHFDSVFSCFVFISITFVSSVLIYEIVTTFLLGKGEVNSLFIRH